MPTVHVANAHPTTSVFIVRLLLIVLTRIAKTTNVPQILFIKSVQAMKLVQAGTVQKMEFASLITQMTFVPTHLIARLINVGMENALPILLMVLAQFRKTVQMEIVILDFASVIMFL